MINFVSFCFFVFLIMIACDGWYGTGVTVSESVKVIITSPNFPFNYDNDKKCIWQVSTSDAGLLIKATINEFDLQYNTGSGDCPFDSLTFSDGDSSGGDVNTVIPFTLRLFIQLKMECTLSSRVIALVHTRDSRSLFLQ